MEVESPARTLKFRPQEFTYRNLRISGESLAEFALSACPTQSIFDGIRMPGDYSKQDARRSVRPRPTLLP
ncbi:MAG TPA: hypothetical protein VN517_19200, partial [Terriglobales bacterium]|nr:hypothetical protein [Terriglobales bacterium]